MASSAMLLDLTLSDLEGQNQDWANCSTQNRLHKLGSSIGKYSWMTFILENTPLGYPTPWRKFLVHVYYAFTLNLQKLFTKI